MTEEKHAEIIREDTMSCATSGHSDSRRKRGFGIGWYYVLNLLATGLTNTIAVVVWSTSMGIGKASFQALEDLAWLMTPFGGMFLLVIVVLYLLDFFNPPHLPGQMMRLWDGDAFVGRGLLVLAGAFLLCAVLLLTPSYPGIPVVVTTMLCPVCVVAVHSVVRPGARLPKGELLRDIVERGDVRSKMSLLKDMLGSEKDQLAFYKAATWVFITNFLAIIPLWVVFAVVLDKGKEGVEDATSSERDKIYIQWATPLLVAISNFVFTLFGLLRVFMQNTYSATDVYRNRLIADTMTSSLHDELLEYKLAVFEGDDKDCSAAKERYLTRHVQHIKQLSMLVKVVGCTFVLVIGALYVVGQLLYANSDIAFMVLGLLGAFFVLFLLFVSVSFSRILWAMGQWLQDLPAWKALRSVSSWPSIRAFFLCCLFPAIPISVLLSFLNQQVRRCRGLDKVARSVQGTTLEESLGFEDFPKAKEMPALVEVGVERSAPPLPEQEQEQAEPASPMILTQRLTAIIEMVRLWDFVATAWWVYVLCGLYVCYNVFPLLINVGLSWLRHVTASWNFAVIIASTFLIGVVAFLLPPVPGMTVYIFGGLVISGTCPSGFWAGTAVNVVMCWFLKLVACAIQQKCIGGLLGRSLWVRKTARVHKVAIRCIEAELRQKGWTIGKVAILCGGPDWPTSVIAGVLGLSLWECELGTVPIIGFVMPCALTGSLYIKKDEGQIWASSADLMVVAAVSVNMLLWALAFWAIQNRLEADFEELNRRLPEHVDLHWLDYRASTISERATVKWSETPVCVRAVYILGAATQIVVCYALTFGYSFLFGGFAVQDDIRSLVFFPTEGKTDELFTWYAIAVLGVYFSAFACFLQHACWRSWRAAEPQRQAAKELDMHEAEWKEAFLRELAEENALRKLAKSDAGAATPSAPPEEEPQEKEGSGNPYITAPQEKEGSGNSYITVVPPDHVPSEEIPKVLSSECTVFSVTRQARGMGRLARELV